MAVPGTAGKILVVDLATQSTRFKQPGDEVYLKYLGGYGLGHLPDEGDCPGGPPPHPDLAHAEGGVLGGDPEVALHRYLETQGGGDAVDGGDDRL